MSSAHESYRLSGIFANALCSHESKRRGTHAILCE